MRVLHLDSGRQMRGGQWQVLRLIEGLASSAIDSTLLAREASPLFQAARALGWHVEPLTLGRLAVEARRHDLVHAHDARAHTLAAAVAGRKPLVVARRVAFPVGAGVCSRWKYGRARQFVAVSQFVGRVLVEGGIGPARVAVVYDGVPLLPPSEGGRVLMPNGGGDSLKETGLAAEAARLAGVRIEVSTDLERDLRTAAVFVYLTRSEGLGSGALLAMSAGVAVVASDVGGLQEALQHRATGMLVENSPAAVAAAIGELTGNPEFARSLGAAARRRVRERFTVDRMVLDTLNVYRQVLS